MELSDQQFPLTKVSGSFLGCGGSNFSLKVTDTVTEGKFISNATETALCKGWYATVCPNNVAL